MARGIKLTEIELTKIADMYCTGRTYKEIAEETGLSLNAVYTNVKNNPKCKEYIEQFRHGYQEELLDIAIDSLKSGILDANVPSTIKIQYIQTALKYSGVANGDNVHKVFNVNEMSLADIDKLKYR